MKSKRIIQTYVALLALFIPTVQAHAQGAGATAPIGPIRQGTDNNALRQLPVPGARGSGLESAQGAAQVRADTHTLSSIEALGLGSVDLLRRVVDPSFHFSQSVDTGIIPGATTGATALGTSLTFDRNWSRSRFTALYSGAQVLYYPDASLNAAYHSATVAQEITWARWVLRLRNDLLVSPEAPFGGLDTGGVNTSGGTLNNLQPSIGAGESILTERAQRLRNTASGEVNYLISRRSVLTVAGSYDLLNFMTDGYIDSNRITGRVGYDYALHPKDSIALMYDYDRTSFSTSSLLQTDTIQLAYGRRITGRLAFQVAGGPKLLNSTAQGNTLTWAASSAMTYQTRRTQYALSYAHMLSNGSGVYSGADSDGLSGSVSHTLTRSWSASLGAGYAFERAVEPANGVISHFRNWYGSVSVARPLGHHLLFHVDYTYRHQGAGAGTCPVVACGSTQGRQALNVTLDWHPWSILPR